ncbi:hypothetical protein PHMEG_00010906 [Phytophthora megakarya]|uniref:Reverse transcriptase Ty1/copia-type domain-containing protein n=1 Tax=Phytophthora megakarya TaxID=4795 RepID=A0A225WDG9_9STRA|nr:hypothetical protein PHMEG_00010906 [Phytophthora megakarya]
MNEELESLRQHGVWQIVDREVPGTNVVITNKLVFAVKKYEHGLVKRFKGRLVIHGFKQMFGVNYSKTFTPVIRFKNTCGDLFCCSAEVYDVKTVFLHGKLGEAVFMELLQGQGSSGNRQNCRLIMSLYHLKQGPHAWIITLRRHLVMLGFSRLESDDDLYILHKKEEHSHGGGIHRYE